MENPVDSVEPDTGRLVCAHRTCSRYIPNHRWSKTKAEGWFQQRDGTVWCWEHVPEWVEQWRKKRKQRTAKR